MVVVVEASQKEGLNRVQCFGVWSAKRTALCKERKDFSDELWPVMLNP
jgi:hypothetical protein